MAKLSMLKLKKSWYMETADELDKLLKSISNERISTINELLQSFKSAFESCSSDYAKSFIFSYYSNFANDNLRYENNLTSSVSLNSRKIALKTAIVFIVCLVLSILYILMAEAVKKHGKS